MAYLVSYIFLTLTFIFMITLTDLDVCSAVQVCTESVGTPRVPLTMNCVLLGSGDNLFDTKIMNDARKAEEFEALHITTEGCLILPSLDINESYLKHVRITAKKGIDLASGVFARIDITFLELNYDWYEPVIPGLQSNALRLDELSASILSIGGIKNVDLSAVRRIGTFNYMGSSDGLTIKWPTESVLDKILGCNLKTDRFLPDFRKMRNLIVLRIHSLPSLDQAQPVADLVSNLMQMDLSAVNELDLSECYTPGVIKLPFNQMPELQRLNLENNKIECLPSEFEASFGVNGNLSMIELDENLIRAIPANFFNFEKDMNKYGRHLRHISISDNPITEIGENAFAKIGTAHISLADKSNVSLQAFSGIIEELRISLIGNASIGPFQNEFIQHKFGDLELNIRCGIERSACASICPNLTIQICEVIDGSYFNVDIDESLCYGKTAGLCRSEQYLGIFS